MPPALMKGASKKKKAARMKSSMHELEDGPVESPSRKAAAKKGTAHKQNIAIAMKSAGMDKGKKKTAKKK